MIQSAYLSTVFDVQKLQKAIPKTVEVATSLREKYHYDTIVFTGLSGAAMAFILSAQLSLPLLCVRKKEDRSHFHQSPNIIKGSLLEGNYSIKRYMIVDDFISSGKTIDTIARAIKDEIPTAVCTCILMYANQSWFNWLVNGEMVETSSSQVLGESE